MAEAVERRRVCGIRRRPSPVSKLTAQLLAFARRQPLKPEVFDVGTQVDNVVQLIRPLVGGVYRLSDFHRAQADFIAKDFVGKLVVVPDAMWNSKTHL